MRDIQLSSNLFPTPTISRFITDMPTLLLKLQPKIQTLSQRLYRNFKHGMSVIDAYGAYSNKKFYICKTVISSYEEADVIDCVLNVAPNVIINSYKTNHFYGKVNHQPMARKYKDALFASFLFVKL